MPRKQNDDDDDPGSRRTAGLMALVVILVLLVAGLWLQQHMRANAILEDCVLSGRRNCTPIPQQ